MTFGIGPRRSIAAAAAVAVALLGTPLGVTAAAGGQSQGSSPAQGNGNGSANGKANGNNGNHGSKSQGRGNGHATTSGVAALITARAGVRRAAVQSITTVSQAVATTIGAQRADTSALTSAASPRVAGAARVAPGAGAQTVGLTAGSTSPPPILGGLIALPQGAIAGGPVTASGDAVDVWEVVAIAEAIATAALVATLLGRRRRSTVETR